MKNINKYLSVIALSSLFITVISCNKSLDIAPSSVITSENYLHEESHLASYAIKMYEYLPTMGSNYGIYGADSNTDNQTESGHSTRFVLGEYKVKDNGTDWDFEKIFTANYFLDTVLPRQRAGTLTGNEDMINHYIGEVYFFRAYANFIKLKSHGDYPIVRNTLDNKMEELILASKRAPRNEFARFIMSDLDSAILLMRPISPDGANNRLSQPVAQLFKSRVALYEASWLRNFKGTAFVPGGDGWPGANKDYNADFAYVAGSIDSEVEFFLTQAMESSKVVADAAQLTENTGITPQPGNINNPYFWMYADNDLSGYPEVLLWKQSNRGFGITNNINVEASRGNAGVGITRGLVMSFLDVNGLPWYAPGALFTDDSDITKVRENRDSRATIFIKEPGQHNMWINLDKGTHGNDIEFAAPRIYEVDYNKRYVTGYAARKGQNPDRSNNDNLTCINSTPHFRSAEALLNYIEASYMLTGNLSGEATRYWNLLRERAGITAPISTTIASLDMTKEAMYDWGAYTAGQLIDKTLFAIRKERRSEYMCEGIRDADLKRWRSFDQMISTPYFVEGMKIWNSPNYDLFTEEEKVQIVFGESNTKSIVSDPKFGDYMIIHKVRSNSLAFNGYTWQMAHYLTPIEIQHMRITSPTGSDPANSPIYQNPYWPLTASLPAER